MMTPISLTRKDKILLGIIAAPAAIVLFLTLMPLVLVHKLVSR